LRIISGKELNCNDLSLADEEPPWRALAFIIVKNQTEMDPSCPIVRRPELCAKVGPFYLIGWCKTLTLKGSYARLTAGDLVFFLNYMME
jgi:hypothetical protein